MDDYIMKTTLDNPYEGHKESLLKVCRQYDIKKNGTIPFIQFVTLAKKNNIVLTDVVGSMYHSVFLNGNKGRCKYEQFINDLTYELNDTGSIKTNKIPGKWVLKSRSTRGLSQHLAYSEAQSNEVKSRNTESVQHFNTTGNAEVPKNENLVEYSDTPKKEIEKPISKTVSQKESSKLNSDEIPKDLLDLSKLLYKDGFRSNNLFKLRTFFIACSFTDQGLASRVEFETIVSKSKSGVSHDTLTALVKFLVVQKDKGKISYFKLKKLMPLLAELLDQISTSCQLKAEQEGDQNDDPDKADLTKLGNLDTSKMAKGKVLGLYFLMIEMKMEEKFKNIGQAFRTFDTDGDSKITFEEFWKGITNVGVALDKQTCKDLFDYLDENNDQFIEFSEFCCFFETIQDRKGDYRKYSKNATQNCIFENYKKHKGVEKPQSPVRFAAANIFGIANEGMTNPIKSKLENTRQSAFSQRSVKTSSKKHSEIVDDMLSTISSSKGLKMRKEIPENLDFYKSPTPKNKDIGKFISDCDSARSTEYNKHKMYPLPIGRNDRYTFGAKNQKDQNIAHLLHHDYLTYHAEQIEKKQSRIKLEQEEKARKAKDWKNYKWNNAQAARYHTIKQRYFSPEHKSGKLGTSPSRRSYQQLPSYMLNRGKSGISKEGDFHIGATVRN